MVELSLVEQRIRQGVEGVTHVAVKDLTGTKDHLEATVVASGFEGKSRVQMHQMVYAALGELMSGPVHALKLRTLTPEAWDAQAEG